MANGRAWAVDVGRYGSGTYLTSMRRGERRTVYYYCASSASDGRAERPIDRYRAGMDMDVGSASGNDR